MALQNQNNSVLSTAIAQVRKVIDDPSTRPKFQDPDIVQLLSEAWPEVLTDIQNTAAAPVITSMNITLVADQREYATPPNMGEIINIGLVDDSTGLPVGRSSPGSVFDVFGYRYRFESKRLILECPPSTGGQTWQIQYVPTGEVSLASGTLPKASATTTTVTLSAATLTTGNLDRRPNAYLGSILTLFRSANSGGTERLPSGYSLFPIQERVITEQRATDARVSFAPALDFDPSGLNSDALLHWELLPSETNLILVPVINRTVQKILFHENKVAKYQLAEREYQKSIRAAAAKTSSLVLKSMPSGTQHNVGWEDGSGRLW